MDLLVRLNDLPNFSYIKDSAGDMTTHQAYLQTGCKVLNGADPTTVFALMAGATGTIWGGSNYMPKECVRLYELVASGDFKAAMDLWATMIPSLLYIWSGNYIAKVKYASQLRGFGAGGVRRPLTPLSDGEKRTLATALQSLG